MRGCYICILSSISSNRANFISSQFITARSITQQRVLNIFRLCSNKKMRRIYTEFIVATMLNYCTSWNLAFSQLKSITMS